MNLHNQLQHICALVITITLLTLLNMQNLHSPTSFQINLIQYNFDQIFN